MSDYLNGIFIRLQWLGQTRTVKGWQDIRQSRGGHTLFWIAGGEGTLRGETVHQVGKGMLVYMPPGREMLLQSSIGDPLDMRIARFECVVNQYSDRERAWSAAPLQRLELPTLRPFHGERAERLHEQFEQLVGHWAPGSGGGELLARSRLLAILEEAHRDYPEDTGGDPALQAFVQIKTMMEDRFYEPLHVYELATRHAISPSYLRKLFQARLGVSPKGYLDQLRDAYAVRCLTYSDAPIKVVARLCGYNDEFQFSKAFKKTHDCTPSEFRSRQLRKMRAALRRDKPFST